MASQSVSHILDDSFPLLEGILDISKISYGQRLISRYIDPVFIPHGDGLIDRRTCQNIGQMEDSDLISWRRFIASLGLTELLKYRDGRRVYRYLADLAYQYHICTILLYMAVFDPFRKNLRSLLTPSEFQRINQRVRRSRNKFAHGNTLCVEDYLGQTDFEFVASLVSIYKHHIVEPLTKSSHNNSAVSPLLGLVDDRCFLSIAQMKRHELQEWFELVKHLGLCELREYWDGRRLLRYLVDLAYQFHICTILMYMSLFDPFDKAALRAILSDSEYHRINQKIRKSRHKFAHGIPFTTQDYLDRDDFEFVASLFRRHKTVLIQNATR